MKYLIIGKNGMLGSVYALQEVLLQGEMTCVDIDEINITDYPSVKSVFHAIRPNIVINCSAYTNVDGAETEHKLAWAVNVDGVKNIAEECKKIGAFLVHYSTDFIFNGKKTTPYTENDPPSPINRYGLTKLEGERSIQRILSNTEYLIVRTSWLFGPRGGNFISTIIELARKKPELSIVDDQRGNPTFTRDLAYATSLLINNNAHGIYNVTNTGNCTWYDLARFVLDSLGMHSYPTKPISSDLFIRPAKRPSNSVLSLEKLQCELSYSMPTWQDAVTRYIEYQFNRHSN